MDDCLILRLRINKASYKVGDSINFSLVLENKGKEEIRVLKRPLVYRSHHLKFFDSNNREMTHRPVLIYEPSPFSSADFRQLKSGEKMEFNIEGSVTKKNPLGLKESNVGHDLFLNFKDSFVHLKSGPGSYKAIARFSVDPVLLENTDLAKGDKSIWLGEVSSQSMLIQIIEDR